MSFDRERQMEREAAARRMRFALGVLGFTLLAAALSANALLEIGGRSLASWAP